MSGKSTFRIVLIASLVVEALQVVASLALQGTLPPALQAYVAQANSADTSGFVLAILSLLAIGLLVLLIVVTVGLWNFKPWARVTYVVIEILAFLAIPISGAVVMNGWAASFNYLSTVSGGILLAMMFTGTTATYFSPRVVRNSVQMA